MHGAMHPPGALLRSGVASGLPALQAGQIAGALSRTFGSHRPAPRPAHHPYVVLALHVGGTARVDHHGTFDVSPGDLHIIPAGDAHRMIAADDAEIHGALFCPTCIDRTRVGSLMAPIDRVLHGGAPVVTLSPERLAHTKTLFAELARESAAPAPSQPVLESLLTLVLAEVARAAPALGGAENRPMGVAAEALAFIEKHAFRPLSLRDVAQALSKNTTYVADAVKRATGRTVGEWITQARMGEARRRLAETDEYVDVIAERVGYADATHFARVFKRTFCATPRAFREAQRRRG